MVSGIVWYDTVPQGVAPVYMSYNMFGDEGTGEEQGWSQPRLMADNPNFQVEYSSDYVKDGKSLPNLNLFVNNKTTYSVTISEEGHSGTYVVSGEYNKDEGVNEEAWRNLCNAAGYGT